MAAEKSKKLAYELRKFDAEAMGATTECWQRDLSKHKKDLMPTTHEGRLAWAIAHMDYAQDDGNSLAYGIFRDGEPHAVAIVEIVYTKSGTKWLKMLDLTLSPSLDLAFSSQATDYSAIYSVFAAAIIGAIRLTKANHPTKVTKLYGRHQTLLTFLGAVGESIKQDAVRNNLDVSVSIEGRWLVLKQK